MIDLDPGVVLEEDPGAVFEGGVDRGWDSVVVLEDPDVVFEGEVKDDDGVESFASVGNGAEEE